jgi:hypothetical protein
MHGSPLGSFSRQEVPVPATFALNVIVTGLCVLRWRPSDQALDVLMVEAANHHSAKHHPRILYDQAYASNDPNQLPKPSNKCYEVTLRQGSNPGTQRWVDLSGLANSSGDPGSLDLIDVGALIGATLPLDRQAIPNLAACVTLPFDSSAKPDKGAGVWELYVPEQGVEHFDDGIPPAVRWTIRAAVDPGPAQLKWKLLRLDGTEISTINTLYPKPPNTEIELLICNLPETDCIKIKSDPGKAPKKKQPMEHFSAFYDLYEYDGYRPVPVYIGPAMRPESEELSLPRIRSTSYTCVPSKGS